MNEHQRKRILKSVFFEKMAYDQTDIVTNGDFSAGDTGWTLVNCSVVGGKVVAAAHPITAILLRQTVTPTHGVLYEISFTLSDVVAGGVTPILGGTDGVACTTDGTHKQFVIAGSDNDYLILTGRLDFDGKIDDVACCEAKNVVYVPYGTVACEVRPQGDVILNIGSSSVNVDLTANEWNPAIGFDADGVTKNTITLYSPTGDIECHVHCLVDTELNADCTETA